MSGIAAVIRFDGAPIEPGTVGAMTAAMHYRGVDGIAHWSDGQAALGHCMLHTTAESLEEKQPLASEDGNRVLVFHGWLSNPDEVRGDLLACGARLRDRSDAELVLRAYEVWGDDCPHRIDGEFAFLVWDKVRQEAFLARDHMGLKSLHYCWDGKQLVVATDIVGVLAVPGIEAVPNRGKIAEYLTGEFTELEETIWQGVMCVAPAHWMRFGRGGARRGRYWQPPHEIAIRYQRDEDYFDHYRTLFADCVRRASRSHRPLACDVSGGLDSSAIFAMAHDLHRKGELPAPDVNGYGYFIANARGTPADEIDYVRAVASHLGVDVAEIAPFMPETEWFAERGRQDRDFVGYPNCAMWIAIGKAATSSGSRVLLNGEGGDEWLNGTVFYLSELIGERSWPALSEAVSGNVARFGLGGAARDLFSFGLAPHLPQSLLAFRQTLRRRFMRNAAAQYGWLAPDLQQMLSQRLSAAAAIDNRHIRNIAPRLKYMSMIDPGGYVARSQISRQSARLGYEVRSPMHARSFVEFAFTTPERIRFRAGQTKFVHRRALKDLLPAVVTNRETKAHFNLAIESHIFHETGQSIRQALQQIDNDYCDREALTENFEQIRRNPNDFSLMWAVWGVFAIASLF